MAEITRGQIDKAIEAARPVAGMAFAQALLRELDNGWLPKCPGYVRDAWHASGWDTCAEGDPAGKDALLAALTRWRDSLPVAKVARRSGVVYMLSPRHDMGDEGCAYSATRAQAIAWGYTIEGGPEPLTTDQMADTLVSSLVAAGECEPEDSPERLKARREALGMHGKRIEHILDGLDVGVGAYKGDGGNGRNRRMVAEGDPDGCDSFYDSDEMEEIRAAYAAALSAEESVRAAKRQEAAAHHATRGQGALSVEEQRRAAKPEPAPEVVDVPQPLPKTVAHFYTIRALPETHRVSWNMSGDGPQWVRINDALWLHVDDLRAMLADIDAQGGGHV